MINQTITSSFFHKTDTALQAHQIGITELTDASVQVYLEHLLQQKAQLEAAGITRISLYHTLLYENQCNTEFSPQVLALLLQFNATFCISASDLRPIKMLEKVPLNSDHLLPKIMAAFEQEMNVQIPYTTRDEQEPISLDIDVSDLSSNEIFDLGFRYGKQIR